MFKKIIAEFKERIADYENLKNIFRESMGRNPDCEQELHQRLEECDTEINRFQEAIARLS